MFGKASQFGRRMPNVENHNYLNGDEGVLSSLEILGLGVKLGNILCDCHSISLSPISFSSSFLLSIILIVEWIRS